MQTVQSEIERYTRKRKLNWDSHPDCNPQVTYDTTAKLAELYARKRMERARLRHGERELIVKRARVERELERLMND